MRLHWVEAGSGTPVVLLHGFPEFWWGWRRQIPALAGAGLRPLAADLRGYNRSDRPAGIRPYRMEALVGDVAGLIETAAAGRAHVAGHDWGGVIAWYLAMTRPELVDRLVIINAPHPRAFRRELRRPEQMLRSWYAGAFQLPLLPEIVLRMRDYAMIERIFRDSPVRPGAFTEDDIARYVEQAGGPGALTAMLAYYRAATRYPTPPVRTIDHPTMLIWGEKDQALSPRLTKGLEPLVPRLRLECIPDASHWVLAERPERVNELLLDFLCAP
ncbi:MAG TPA: alpha/beta hydrolase [Longimicrobium sp.]|nr:alpha/beta hydrolase [Longimicrobium sp.]